MPPTIDPRLLDAIVRAVMLTLAAMPPSPHRRREAALRGLIARTRDIAADVEAALDHIEVLDGER